MAKYDYDFFVIGGGSGGVRAARIAAQHGAKVGLAEESRYGGTCVIRGCVPKKLFVYASRFAHDFEDSKGFGWSSSKPEFNWQHLIQNKNKELDRLESLYKKNLSTKGVELFSERAVLEDTHTIKLQKSGKRITADKILIAVGGRPNREAGCKGQELAITSDEAFDLKALPKSILIAGGGYIAAEFACIFNALGVKTTLIYRKNLILRGFDDGLRHFVQHHMQAQGIEFILDDVFEKIEQKADILKATTKQGKEFEVDQIMLAIGRQPHTKNLGLEKAGIELRSNGTIPVDETSKTINDSLYAVGDVTGRVELTPVAIREGHAVADSLFSAHKHHVDHETIATAVFTTPELGTVGLTQEEATERYDNIDIYQTQFRSMKMTLAGRDEKTFMKIIVNADDDRVLGVHIAGEGAGEIIQCIGIVLKMGAKKADFDQTIAVHPTASEELVTIRSPTEEIRRKR